MTHKRGDDVATGVLIGVGITGFVAMIVTGSWIGAAVGFLFLLVGAWMARDAW